MNILSEHLKHRRAGQSILEYAILLSALCLVVISMVVYLQGSVNARFRIVQDRLNTAAQE